MLAGWLVPQFKPVTNRKRWSRDQHFCCWSPGLGAITLLTPSPRLGQFVGKVLLKRTQQRGFPLKAVRWLAAECTCSPPLTTAMKFLPFPPFFHIFFFKCVFPPLQSMCWHANHPNFPLLTIASLKADRAGRTSGEHPNGNAAPNFAPHCHQQTQLVHGVLENFLLLPVPGAVSTLHQEVLHVVFCRQGSQYRCRLENRVEGEETRSQG